MLSNELEYCLNDAFQRARDERHEFITVEHLLLALLDTPPVVEILKACGADLVRLAPRAQGVHRRFDSAPARRRRRRVDRRAADARLSARAAARGVSRAVERPQGSHAGERARRDLRREAIASGVSARLARRRPARRRQLRVARRAEDPRGEARERRRQRRGARRRGEPARALHHQSQRARRGRQDRSADRAAARDRAHGADSLPPPQEQPAVRRRSRRRQDRARGRARATDRRGQGARRAAPLHDLRARHGLVDRRHEVSRRFREALEGRGRRPEEAARRDPVHRRDSHRDRRGRRVGRRDGRVEPDQARARERRAALHRLDYL